MSVPPHVVIRLIDGRPEHLDAHGHPDPQPGLADMLETHGDRVSRLVDDWATTLARPGDRPTSRRPPTDEEAGSTPHSDPTGNAAIGHDPMRDIDVRWHRAMSTAHGWACQIATTRPQSTPVALRAAARTIGTTTGSMPLTRLYRACVELAEILAMCRPDLTPPEEAKQEQRICPACRTPHDDRRPQCPACRKLHQRNSQMDDDEFNEWVARRIAEGTLSRKGSLVARNRALVERLASESPDYLEPTTEDVA